MAITIASTSHVVQWRCFIGPPWRRSDAADFWDWTALSLAAYTPAPADTTLTADLEPGDNHAHLTTIASWPTAGGAWVLGNAAGECAEYVAYTGASAGQLTGLTRETVDSEQTGHHTSGATVRFWWPVTSDSGETEFTEELDDNVAAVNWGGKLAGLNFPQAAIRNRHLVLIQCRWAEGTGALGNWQNELIGWLLSPQARDDYTHERPWQAEIASSATMLGLVEVAGIRVGANNSALQGSATGSPELAATYKEAGSGEFTAGEPIVSPSSAIDGDMSTLYITERHVGSANMPTAWGIDQVHPAPYVGQGGGYKWVQLYVTIADPSLPALTWYRVMNQAGYTPAGLTWNAGDTLPDSGCVILVEDATRFREENPDTGDAEIREATNCTLWDGTAVDSGTYSIADWWASLTAAGGALQLLVKQGAVEADPAPSEIIWGSPGARTWVNEDWSGSLLPALTAGQTIRRVWTGGTSGLDDDSYLVGRPSMPGYFLNGTDYLWHSTERRPMGLRLKSDITATNPPTPTDELDITSDLGDTVDGLPASGTLQIGAEQITYTAKAADNKSVTGITRGANSTTAATHSAGDTVYFVESSVATDALPLATINVKRKAGKPAPKNFVVYGSRLSTPTEPDPADGGWVNDWTALATVTGNTADTYTLTLSPSARYRHVCITCTLMESDPYRLMLNEIELIDDPSVFASTRNLPDGSTAAEAMITLLDLGGCPTGGRIDAGDTPAVSGYQTDTGMCFPVVADVASFTGCRATCGRDSKITLALDPFWSAATYPAAAHVWTNTVIGRIEPTWTHGYGVGQISLKWQDATNGTKGTAVYPADCDALGGVVEVGPFYCVDAAAALAKAEKLYWLKRLPFMCPTEAAGPGWEVNAGEVAQNTWQVDTTMNALVRQYLVKSVTARLAGMAVTVLPVLQQIASEHEH